MSGDCDPVKVTAFASAESEVVIVPRIEVNVDLVPEFVYEPYPAPLRVSVELPLARPEVLKVSPVEPDPPLKV